MRNQSEKLPIPTRATKARISTFAEETACALRFKSGDTMEPLVARLGGRIKYRSSSEKIAEIPEAIKISEPNKFTIYLPLNTSMERDRFTIAHELGHLFLHFPLVRLRHPDATMIATRWVDDTREDQTRAEWEANWFAGAFLMPDEEFRAWWGLRTPGKVASTFGVTEKAAEVRAKTLGMEA